MDGRIRVPVVVLARPSARVEPQHGSANPNQLSNHTHAEEGVRVKQHRTACELQERWEQAIERASEETASGSELDREALSAAAGLHVQSGVKSGLWGVTHTCSCDHTCGSAVC